MHFVKTHPIARDGATWRCPYCGWTAVQTSDGRIVVTVQGERGILHPAGVLLPREDSAVELPASVEAFLRSL